MGVKSSCASLKMHTRLEMAKSFYILSNKYLILTNIQEAQIVSV